MKIWGIVALSALLVASAVLVWKQQRAKNNVQHREAAALQTKVQALESALAEAQTQAPAQRTAPDISNVAPVPGSATPPTNAVGVIKPASNQAPNAAMLQDPETRALMRKQQELAIRKAADKIITKDFIRDWNLSPATAERLKELYREKTLAAQDVVNAMMFDGIDDAALGERGRATKERILQTDETLRGLLGPDGFNALREQEQMTGDRDRLRRIREEMATAEVPLSKAQQDSLLETMGAERQAFSFRIDLGDPWKIDYEHLRDFFSMPNLDMYIEDMQQLSARIAERASLFLSAQQVEQLRTAQQNHLEQTRLTVKMTTELFNKPRKN
jgi:hypothetical protein